MPDDKAEFILPDGGVNALSDLQSAIISILQEIIQA
ncbi:hypothetical protein P296_03360 [Salmonella enterica subsp. arizonae serovar 18:z4,z23:- str. CVM N26624]|uniref:Uncharacterized protein n=2 Tax=Salmonella enterica subsp. arizonae TaxID=59203 RepID=A9MHV8_SALAR|nr:hypothetical protein SARI_01966 [Salmonella enterica subsp. arizonae serovar 62:z4,z23:-]AIP97552.1 hypothetical protein N898_09485 [Salmonella enterica subsp. arizonae serovar 62:z36:- str. RKS2983]OLV94134.1 hypothetical protein P296_03360 [Salmonella enterica subsp. arizonae serovar 18:z4,z23:- str. CVM N26624]OLV98327.1 hypothetical protein P297_03545 [Salmonella enterica subsp. arizonae serovar 18:z4,z23:- str. CVM N26625]OLW01499.1 hypothetical protein P298_11425 [Salmonella enterica s